MAVQPTDHQNPRAWKRRQALCFETRKVEQRFSRGSTAAPSVFTDYSNMTRKGTPVVKGCSGNAMAGLFICLFAVFYELAIAAKCLHAIVTIHSRSFQKSQERLSTPVFRLSDMGWWAVDLRFVKAMLEVQNWAGKFGAELKLDITHIYIFINGFGPENVGLIFPMIYSHFS